VLREGEQPEPHEALKDNVAILESAKEEVTALIRSLDVDLVVVGLDDPNLARDMYPQLRRLRFENIEVLSPLVAAEIYSGRTPIDLISEEYLVHASLESAFPAVRRVKRIVDIIISGAACILCLPIAAVIAALIKLENPRAPALYSQVRVGQFGETFRIHKFRTMHPNAEGDSGAVWATVDDARITRIGAFLRRFRLDEIPQFVNILRGEMSLVGPRPERPEITGKLMEDVPYYTERENVLPGLTGWAQIQYPYASCLKDAVRKLEYDLFYIKHLSLSLDLQIILRSIRIVLFGKERKI
jgi:lipopolysaccharide/colanic/teichoic acid biosynthesis glycosyltransferase